MKIIHAQFTITHLDEHDGRIIGFQTGGMMSQTGDEAFSDTVIQDLAAKSARAIRLQDDQNKKGQ